ncbi:hypothetical protein XELAEV_18037830mg [Xenopus laevis]|uniref:Uncharacterized protein n=1 Tax=Xenopus laevis TaxID=8355 RepID=A0A974CE16_XENLA|nr:hypothetical protein XELAEV_18037830mg [Xenopus laevis]
MAFPVTWNVYYTKTVILTTIIQVCYHYTKIMYRTIGSYFTALTSSLLHDIMLVLFVFVAAIDGDSNKCLIDVFPE